MHISEGVLSAPVLVGSAVMAVAGTGIGLKKIDYDHIVHVAILSSAFFVASLIHVNIGPSSTHLILNGIVGLLLGPAAFPAILTALILQAVLFGYGGITVLGVNTLIMAVPAVLVHYLCISWVGRSPKMTTIAGFVSGSLSVFLSAILLVSALWFTNENFIDTCKIILLANAPIILIEGIVTGFCLSFLVKVYPEILPPLRRTKEKRQGVTQ